MSFINHTGTIGRWQKSRSYAIISPWVIYWRPAVDHHQLNICKARTPWAIRSLLPTWLLRCLPTGYVRVCVRASWHLRWVSSFSRAAIRKYWIWISRWCPRACCTGLIFYPQPEMAHRSNRSSSACHLMVSRLRGSSDCSWCFSRLCQMQHRSGNRNIDHYLVSRSQKARRKAILKFFSYSSWSFRSPVTGRFIGGTCVLSNQILFFTGICLPILSFT